MAALLSAKFSRCASLKGEPRGLLGFEGSALEKREVNEMNDVSDGAAAAPTAELLVRAKDTLAVVSCPAASAAVGAAMGIEIPLLCAR